MRYAVKGLRTRPIRVFIVVVMAVSLIGFGAAYPALAFPHADTQHHNVDRHDFEAPSQCGHEGEFHGESCHASACFGLGVDGSPVPVQARCLLVFRMTAGPLNGLQRPPDIRPPRHLV